MRLPKPGVSKLRVTWPKVGQRFHLAVVLLLLCGMGGAAIARIGYLDVTGDFLRRQGDARALRTEVIEAHRGALTDRRGELLAVSTPVESVWADPGDVAPGDPKLAVMAQLLDLNLPALHARLEANRPRNFLYVRRRVSLALAAQVRALHIRGIGFRREYKRYYPSGEIIAHVVGLTNVDDHGIDGAELAFDRELQGVQGRKRVLKDRNGTTFRDLEYLKDARPGQDLPLSLDLRLQYLAYRELKRAVSDEGASAASLVMLDARTGEILALVNQPSFNPNRDLPADPAARRDRAVTDLYEPGSTMKPFAMTAALETGAVRIDTLVDTSPGSIRVAGKTISDPHDKGVLTLGQILAFSSQVGITKVALQLPERANVSVLQRVGLMESTGARLPGEALGHMSQRQFFDRSRHHGLRLRLFDHTVAARPGLFGVRQRRYFAAADAFASTGCRTRRARARPARRRTGVASARRRDWRGWDRAAGAGPWLSHRRQDRHGAQGRNRWLPR